MGLFNWFKAKVKKQDGNFIDYTIRPYLPVCPSCGKHGKCEMVDSTTGHRHWQYVHKKVFEGGIEFGSWRKIERCFIMCDM